jgi:transaldolase
VNVKIYADGADKARILELAKNPEIKGFTTNPTLMKQAGVSDYLAFAHDVLSEITDRSISFEVFSDDFDEMEKQALLLASLAGNVFVKIPVTNTKGEPSAALIKRLAEQGVQLNVTAIFTDEQVRWVYDNVIGAPAAYISIFAGRIADAGVDPMPTMRRAVELVAPTPHIEIIWASPREVLNIVQADSVGCHIITVTSDLLAKLPNIGKDLDEYSLDTVKMFYRDAEAAGYHL